MTRHIKSVLVYILLIFSVGITHAQPTSDLLAMVTDDLADAETTIKPFFADLAYSNGNGISEYNRLHTGGNSPFNNHPIYDEISGKVAKYSVEATSDGSYTLEDSSIQTDHTDSATLKVEKTGCELLNMLANDFANSGTTLRPFFEDAANAGGKAFKAWEALFDLPLLRTNVTKLQAVSDFAVAKNIDPSIIKTELQSLSGYKDDLVKGFEISNGTAQLPKIVNKGDISTTGALHGSFINGQFVPNGNALPNGIMDFVALPNGQILLGTKHTFLSQGADVLAAGTVKLTDGVVKDITNLSGHYLPNPGEAMNFLRVFKNAGVNVDQSFLSIYKENGTIFKQVHITANARKLYE